MSFVEWYKETFEENWHEDYAGIYSFADKIAKQYENWCEENNVKPVWNG